jgi:rod shape-determining protein MreB
MFGRRDIGIDLGTATVLIYTHKEGIVINEPSIIAINEKTREVIAVGDNAKRMRGRTPANIRIIRPLKEGVISDFEATEKMLKYFIVKAIGRRLYKPRIAVCVPTGVTEIEKKSVEDVTRQAGAKNVYIIEEPIAAAIGAGIDIGRPCGSMVVDIGGGTTDIAVISLGGNVVSRSLKVAGDNFDQAIMKYVRKKHSLLIGEPTAEEVKIAIGCAVKKETPVEYDVKGRDLLTGLPKNVIMTSDEMQEALKEPVRLIAEAIHQVLEITPPELAADIAERGLVMTGGSSLLYGLDKFIEQQTGIYAEVAEDSISCVAKGTGVFIDYRIKRERKE